MKKFLSIIGAIGLSITPTTTIIACANQDEPETKEPWPINIQSAEIYQKYMSMDTNSLNSEFLESLTLMSTEKGISLIKILLTNPEELHEDSKLTLEEFHEYYFKIFLVRALHTIKTMPFPYLVLAESNFGGLNLPGHLKNNLLSQSYKILISMIIDNATNKIDQVFAVDKNIPSGNLALLFTFYLGNTSTDLEVHKVFEVDNWFKDQKKLNEDKLAKFDEIIENNLELSLDDFPFASLYFNTKIKEWTFNVLLEEKPTFVTEEKIKAFVNNPNLTTYVIQGDLWLKNIIEYGNNKLKSLEEVEK